MTLWTVVCLYLRVSSSRDSLDSSSGAMLTYRASLYEGRRPSVCLTFTCVVHSSLPCCMLPYACEGAQREQVKVAIVASLMLASEMAL
jgi:hypothetical protein